MSQKSKPGVLQRLIQAPRDVVAGAIYPFQALGLLVRSPQLLSCAIIPIFMNGVLGLALYFGLLLPGWDGINQVSHGLPTGTAQWVASLPVWLSRLLGWLPSGVAFFDDILRIVLAIALFIILGLLLVQFGAILAAPWYGSLAEQVERHQLGQLPTSGKVTLGRALQDIGRAIGFQLKKLLLFFCTVPLLLFVNLLPGIGTLISGVGWVALAAIMVFLDFLDPPLERRRLRFRTKFSMVRRTFPASITFGLMLLWLVSIPLLNLLTVPICIVAGTLYCCDYALPQLGEEEMSQANG
jgi:CysZ protein